MKDLIRELASRDQHNLKLQFQVGLGIILFCFCLLTTTIIYHFQKTLLEEETFRQTELVMSAMEATRGYIREVLRPRMYEELGEDHFIIEAMSTSFITRVIMDRFKETLPAFKYRRVALDARNPNFEADLQEKKMIDYFREHPDRQEWHGTTRLETGRYYTLYQPVIFRDSCLHCHGQPDDSPPAIRQSYGSTRGFNREPDEIAGLLSISIPLEVGLEKIRAVSLRMFGMVLLLALLLYSTIWLLFQQLIVTNLRDLITLFRTCTDSSGKEPPPKRMQGHREELAELFLSARTLVTDLQDSRSQLVKYADNLEIMVAERTEALKLSEEMLRDQVKKRNRELQLYNTLTGLITRKESLQSILHQALHEVLQVVPAKGAGMYLYHEENESFTLQSAEQAPLLPDRMALQENADREGGNLGQQLITGCDQIRISTPEQSGTLNISIPLCCRNRLLGIMVLTGLDFMTVNDTLKDLLLSIGQQIGITIESLQNIQNLRRGTELLQSVFDGISDPLILLSPDGTLEMVNQAFLARNTIDRETALGMTVDTIGSQRQCIFSGRMRDLDLKEKKPHTVEVQLDDGSMFDISLYPILNRDESVRALVCFAKDVTDIKKTERRIQQTEKLVAVGQLAAGVAHEINNPLGVILCYADIIKENNQNSEETINDITTIERHAENCRRIVADLLDFSRSREAVIDRQYCSVNGIIQSVISMVQQQFQNKQINLVNRPDDSIPLCFVDSRRMKQVLLNLIMNSGQAIGRGGNIFISTRAEDDRVIIELHDDGPGIDKEIIDKIFDPFFSTKEPGQGTGLGLSVSYGIVREHDGEILVQSTPGHGAVFTIILPISGENDSDE